MWQPIASGDMGELLVRGHASGGVTPDEAAFTVTVTGRDPRSSEGALQEAARLADALDAEIAGRREGERSLVRRVTVSSVILSESYEYRGNQRQLVGYVAQRTTEIVCAPDAEGLTDLVAATAANGLRLAGPNWQVKAGNPGIDAVRAAAVADARHRAGIYAAAAGQTLGVVRAIAEPGLRIPAGGGPVATGEMRMVSRAMAAPGEEVPPSTVRIEVEPVEVSVDVEMVFDLI